MGEAGGAAVEESRSPLLRIGVVVVGAALLVGALVRVVGIGNDNAEDDEDAGEEESAGQELAPMEAASLEGLQPALEAVEAELGAAPRLWEIGIWPDRVTVAVQVPDEPQFVDRYTWQDGDLSRPAPVELAEADPAALAEDLFEPRTVGVEAVSAALDATPAEHADYPDTELVPTSVNISRYGAGADGPTPIITVLASGDDEPETDQWVLTFGPDGSLLRTFEAGG